MSLPSISGCQCKTHCVCFWFKMQGLLDWKLEMLGKFWLNVTYWSVSVAECLVHIVSTDTRWGLLLQILHVASQSVCYAVCGCCMQHAAIIACNNCTWNHAFSHYRELCKNGWTVRDAVWEGDGGQTDVGHEQPWQYIWAPSVELDWTMGGDGQQWCMLSLAFYSDTQLHVSVWQDLVICD